MDRKDYHITVKGLSPIQFSHRHNAPKEKGESHDAFERRTWQQKASVEGDHVLVSADALTTLLISAAIKAGMKWKGVKTYGNVFKGGLFVSTPMRCGLVTDIVPNEVDCSAKGISSLTGNPGTMVVRIFPMLHTWGGTYRVHVLRPEITPAVLREHAEFAHAFMGLGAFRPQNGRNFGRAEVVSVEEVKTVRA